VSWFRQAPLEPGSLKFTKMMSMQSPLLVALGWEKPMRNDYWHCASLDKLYEKRGEDFIFIPTKKLSELIKK
jgi:hypothetical protein